LAQPWLAPDSPSTSRYPKAHAEDIGVMLADPRSSSVVIRATGVPKYSVQGRIAMAA
jgi:hypothetical protein